jgi:hypothetical protein
MMNNKKLHLFILSVLALALLVTMYLTGPASAAPAAAPTPVVYSNNGSRAVAPRLMTFFSGTPIANTTPQRVCYDSPEYNTIDLQWVSTPSGVNGATVLLENSNDDSNYYTGATIINNSSTPVSSLDQYALFGRYHCIKVTMANATPAALFIYGVAK